MLFDLSVINDYFSNHPYASTAALIVLSLGGYITLTSRGKSKKIYVSPMAKPGLVVLHGAGAGTTVVNPSPYVLKLQTFLRMAKIDYVYDPKHPLGAKGKMPWIELDGKPYYDSTFIIEFLTERFTIEIDQHLSEEQKAVARVIQKTIEENTIFAALIHNRWIQEPDWFRQMMKLPWRVGMIFKIFVIPKIKKSMYTHGIGRHSTEEIQHITRGDIKAISVLLQDKQFFFGDQPTTLDACVFAFLANILHGLREGSWPNQMVRNEFPNLVEYFERMRERYWPDWDSITDKAASR